jgi:DNA repair protein RecO (recombination protein O)
MASEKTLALVLRIVEFSETSLVVTLLTREFGKSSALAKGARRPKSAFEGALDLLSVSRVLLIPKSGDTLDLLTEAKLERCFRSGQRDLQRLYAGYYVVELLRELTDRDDPHPDLFDLTLETLAALDGDSEVHACLLRFELQMLRLLGHAPMVDHCAGCGREAPEDFAHAAHQKNARIPFGVFAGGVLCATCRTAARGVVLIRPESHLWLTQSLSIAALAVPPPPIPSQSVGELRGLMNRYISNICGAVLRMTPYLSNIR